MWLLGRAKLLQEQTAFVLSDVADWRSASVRAKSPSQTIKRSRPAGDFENLKFESNSVVFPPCRRPKVGRNGRF